MQKVSIVRGSEVLAETVNVVDSLPTWKVNVPKPSPGPATWIAPNGARVQITILELLGSQLILRRPNGLLAGCTWSDRKAYFLNWLKGPDGGYIDKLVPGAYVDGGEVIQVKEVLEAAMQPIISWREGNKPPYPFFEAGILESGQGPEYWISLDGHVLDGKDFVGMRINVPYNLGMTIVAAMRHAQARFAEGDEPNRLDDNDFLRSMGIAR